MKDSYDIVYIGGRLAANTHARYLKKNNPSLKILILEKNGKLSWSPGESTVGVAGLFLIRDLGLSTYCYLNHLPKNGLRFFFGLDKAEDLTECSEIGSNILPIFPTFQIDRKKLDYDLWELNRKIGIETISNIKDLKIELGEQDDLHKVEFCDHQKNHSIKAKWLVHAAGRNAKNVPVFNDPSPITMNKSHHIASAWGRFTSVKDIDLIGDEKWNDRVGHTSRYLSTNHFMYEGFWIWLIPIGSDIVSVGIVYDKTIVSESLGSEEDFIKFLKSKNIFNLFLEDAEILDFQSGEELSYKREYFCSENKWAIIGDAYSFVDPLYSPGSDVIARQAHLFMHLLEKEDDKTTLKKTVHLINEFNNYDFELLRHLYQGQYATFGSYDVFNIKSLWDFYSYTLITVADFQSKNYLDKKWLQSQLDNKKLTLGLLKAIQKGFIDLALYLKERGEYDQRNLKQYSLRQNRFKIEEDMLLFRINKATKALKMLTVSKLVVCELIELRFKIKKFKKRKMVLDVLDWEDLLSFELTETWLNSILNKLSSKLDYTLNLENLSCNNLMGITKTQSELWNREVDVEELL